MTLPWTQLRFVTVGAACAGLHLLVMLGGDRLGLHYAVSLVASYVLVVATGYVLHLRITFREHASRAGFLRYGAVMAANYPLSLLLMFGFCDLAAIPVSWAAPATTVLLAAWNYLSSRWAVSGRRAAGATA